MSSSFLGETFQMIRSNSTQSTVYSRIHESSKWIGSQVWSYLFIGSTSGFKVRFFQCMISNLKKRMSFWRSKKLKSNLQERSLFGSSFIFWQFKVNCLTVDYWLLILIFFTRSFRLTKIKTVWKCWVFKNAIWKLIKNNKLTVQWLTANLHLKAKIFYLGVIF